MGIEMPAEVRWLIPIVVGDSWPEGDETALQRLAEVWKQAATDVDDAMRAADDAVRQASSNMDGEAAEAFKKYWEKFVKGEEATLPKMKDVSEKLSTACRNCAMQIEYAKLSIIIALVILAIQIAVMIASAVASFGASTAGIVPAQLATRAGVQIVFRQLVQQLMQQVGRNLIGKLALQVGIEVATSVATDLAVQGIQLAKGTRDTLDTNMTLDAAKSGLISGVVGAGVGAGMGKALGDGVGDSIGRSIGRNAAEEAVIGAGSALAEGALSEEGIQAEDVLFGATSGAVSGSVSGTKSGIEGVNADIAAPTAGDMPRPTSADMPRPDAAPRMDGPQGPPPTAPPPSSGPDAEAPPRRSADSTSTSYAAPPTEQPQHRATPDATPPASAPQPSQQPQGFSQSSGQSATPTAPAASNAPAAPRTAMPSAPPMGGPSPSSGGGFSPSNSNGPSTGGHSPTGSGGPAPGSSPSLAGNHTPNGGSPTPGSSPSPASAGTTPHSGGPTPAGSAAPGNHAPNPASSGPPPSGPGHAGPAPTSSHPASGPTQSHSPGTGGHPPMSPYGPAAPGQHGPTPPAPAGAPLGVGPQHTSGPGQPSPRPPAIDAVHQSATSTSAPFAPQAFTPPPARSNADAQPPQAPNVPAQHTNAPGPHQAPSRRQPGLTPHQYPGQRPAGPQRSRQHAPPPPQHAAPQRTAPQPPAQQHQPGHHPPAAGLPRPVATTDGTTPHERPTRTPWEERKRLNTPVTLPDNLKHLQNDVKHTKAGLSLHDTNFKAYPQSAAMVAPDPHRYTVDLHGSADDVRVGDTRLSPKDLADIIRSSGDWDGKQPVRLISCQTGTKADGFAAQLSKELGVDVVSPTKDAWVDDMGNVFASSTEFDHKRGDFSPGWPPNGDWVTFKPDGTSTKHDRPTPPGSTPTWGDHTPEGRPRAWRRGEDGTWVTDANDNWHFVPARNAPPPHPVRGNDQPQWTPNQGQPNHRQGPPPGSPPPGRVPPRPQQGPPPQRFPQGGAPQQNPMRHDPRQQPRTPQPDPRRFPQQQPTGFGPRGFDPNQQQHRQGPPNHAPRQAPGLVPNQAQRPPVPPRGPDGRPLPPRPMQAPQPFGPDPRHTAPEHRPQQQQQQPMHDPRPTPAQQPVAKQPEEVQRTPQGLDWVPLDEQLTATRDRQITATEVALRDRALDLYIQENRRLDHRSIIRAEVSDFKVGLDGRFIEKPREIPTLERPDRLTPEYLNALVKHTSDYGEPATPAPSFTPKSDDLPPGRTAQVPHGAYANTVVPVHPSQLHFNTSGRGDRLIHRDEPDFLNKKNALFRRMDHDMAGVYRGDGIRPRGTNGNAEAHITGTTTGSIYTSFTDSLDHVVNRSPSSDTGGKGGFRTDFIVEAYHQFGIDSDSSFHDAGVKSPHRENEYLFAGGMPDENIFRVWELRVKFDEDDNVLSTEVVRAQINPRFKYLGQMGDR